MVNLSQRCGWWAYGIYLIVFTVFSPNIAQADSGLLNGDWRGQVSIRGETRELALNLQMQGTNLRGTLTIGSDRAPIENAKYEGGTLSFTVPSGARDMPVFAFEGKIVDDEMKLSVFATDSHGRRVAIGEATAHRGK